MSTCMQSARSLNPRARRTPPHPRLSHIRPPAAQAKKVNWQGPEQSRAEQSGAAGTEAEAGVATAECELRRELAQLG